MFQKLGDFAFVTQTTKTLLLFAFYNGCCIFESSLNLKCPLTDPVTLITGFLFMTKLTKEYREYLKSREWAEFRAHIIKQRGRKCEKCGETKGAIHAHHLTYERIFVELESDIQLLCKNCHDKAHGKNNKPIKSKAKKKPKKKSKRNYEALSAQEQLIEDRRKRLKKEGRLR